MNNFLTITKDNVLALWSRIHLGSTSGHLLVLIILLLLMSYMINTFLVNSVLGSSYRIFVAPGVILHELAHATFCILTGAPIEKISLFDKTGGSVSHGKSRLPVLGPIMISLAPFVVGLIAIFLMARLIGLKEVDLSTVHFSYDNIIHFVKSIFSQLDLHTWRNWLILYLTLSVAVTMTPSWQDLRNISLTLLFVAICVFVILKYTSINLSLSFLPLQKIVILFDTVTVLLILALVLSMIVYGVSKIFKK